MIIRTETDVSQLDQASFYPLSALHMGFLRMRDFLEQEGHTILEMYRFECLEKPATTIGIVSRI